MIVNIRHVIGVWHCPWRVSLHRHWRSFASTPPRKEENKSSSSAKHREFITKDLINTSLLGIGQVIFLNNTQAGMILLGGLAYGNPWLATMAAWGTVVSTSTAHVVGLNRETLKDGLYGYNGCLVGCASAVFMDYSLLGTTAGAMLCPLVGSALNKGVHSTPQWTLAFNVVTLSMLLQTKPLHRVDAAVQNASIGNIILTGPLKGISQIFLVESSISGLIIIGGIAFYSPLLAAHAIMGSTVGTLTGAAFMAIGVFFVPNRESTCLSIGGAAVTAGLFGALKTAMGDAWRVPALTLPFCAVATGCYWLAGSVPGLCLAKNPHSPEANKPSKMEKNHDKE